MLFGWLSADVRETAPVLKSMAPALQPLLDEPASKDKAAPKVADRASRDEGAAPRVQ